MCPSGVCAAICSSTLGGMAFTISVAMNPGATALTRIWYLASSRAHVRVMPIKPAFAAT